MTTNGIFAEGYTCDALGRRVSTTNTDGTMRHIYDDNWQCIADVDESGNVVASYVWGDGIDKLLAVHLGSKTYYALSDIQGTVWGYADDGNRIVARWTYDAWGNILSEYVEIPALSSLRYRFQGREWSIVTGLVNFRTRWYDPNTGRWLSKDMIGLAGGFNLYEFCGNTPMCENDAMGLWGSGTVINNSHSAIWVKPEHGDAPEEVAPGKTMTDVDGVAVPDSYPDKVFKIPDFTTVTVNDDGTITPVSPRDEKRIKKRGGWKTPKFGEEHPDWKPLLRKSSGK